jgi:hypothetical protein
LLERITVGVGNGNIFIVYKPWGLFLLLLCFLSDADVDEIDGKGKVGPVLN